MRQGSLGTSGMTNVFLRLNSVCNELSVHSPLVHTCLSHPCSAWFSSRVRLSMGRDHWLLSVSRSSAIITCFRRKLSSAFGRLPVMPLTPAVARAPCPPPLTPECPEQLDVVLGAHDGLHLLHRLASKFSHKALLRLSQHGKPAPTTKPSHPFPMTLICTSMAGHQSSSGRQD